MMMMTMTMARMQMTSMARKRCPGRKERRVYPLPQLPDPKVGPPMFHPTMAHKSLVAIRHASSDSDSDYGARSKKKKKSRASGEEIRVSSRGSKIPNYYEGCQELGLLSDEDVDESYYFGLNTQFKEEDEIEAVLGHCRDEERANEQADLWYENVVCISIVLSHLSCR